MTLEFGLKFVLIFWRKKNHFSNSHLRAELLVAFCATIVRLNKTERFRIRVTQHRLMVVVGVGRLEHRYTLATRPTHLHIVTLELC